MEKAEQIRLLRQLMQHLDEGTNVDAGGLRRNPVEVYTSPEIARREWEVFFQSHPQLIGMSGDLPNPGSFVTSRDLAVPVLAVRDDDGTFRAFANVCRHRGTIIETRPRGKQRAFACPFHAWTYSNRGELISVPKSKHFGSVDKASHGLVPLPAVERYGFLWVHPDPEGAIDPEALLGDLVPEFESWDFGRLTYTGGDVYDMRLNWKLAMDTFGETYHFPVLHRNTLALEFYGNVQCYDVFGRNHRMILCIRSIDELRGKSESEWHITGGGFPVYYLFPNVQLNVGANGIILVRAYPHPSDPARSVSQISFYATKESIARAPEMVDERFRVFARVVRDEDYAIAETLQIGAEAGVQDYVTFGRNEPALHHYHNTYRAALGMEPLELIKD